MMDLFYECFEFTSRRKRVHFHSFMLDVHRRIHVWRTNERREGEHDPIPPLADVLSRQFWLLCFDEFQVTDVADAMILKRLFAALSQRGVVFFATSNRVPSELYKGGLNRPLFEPFIHEIQHNWIVHDIDSHVDYRFQGTFIPSVFLYPLGSLFSSQ